ncbi:MAG: hypothetical protein Q8922_02005 [Bacteroidota bacterium]|nr:hypothetical protein [Bacteroidota bacterium]MDP4231999.1 hypothetical protein [Bacteroidota bacterium]MDP4241294.1 hypothetical protein [Bacteroidota bacterium]MDP4286686.1 hypothetical protein [Bacteroidota bacterium]
MKKQSINLSSFLLLILTLAACTLIACGTSQTASTPPSWAPLYTDGAYAPYYYFPDYGIYYDAAAQQYYYLNNGSYVPNPAPPYNVDLDHSYVVMLNRNTSRPWMNHEYYERNYPAHAYDRYGQIVTQNRIIQTVPPDHVITPRAYNENNDRVLFEERDRAAANAREARVATHEVPMRTIAPNMPPEARNYKYGGAQKGR